MKWSLMLLYICLMYQLTEVIVGYPIEMDFMYEARLRTVILDRNDLESLMGAMDEMLRLLYLMKNGDNSFASLL